MTRRIFLQSPNTTIYKDGTRKDCWDFDTTLKTVKEVRKELLPIIWRLENYGIKITKIVMPTNNKCGYMKLLSKIELIKKWDDIINQ